MIHGTGLLFNGRVELFIRGKFRYKKIVPGFLGHITFLFLPVFSFLTQLWPARGMIRNEASSTKIFNLECQLTRPVIPTQGMIENGEIGGMEFMEEEKGGILEKCLLGL